MLSGCNVTVKILQYISAMDSWQFHAVYVVFNIDSSRLLHLLLEAKSVSTWDCSIDHNFGM